uniref:SEFIR domain-containing protein n=1 Tax=Meloidogyne javanica TaxID=6303 RepID=A0A915N1X7_MELJA
MDELAIFFSYICYNLFSLSQYLLDIFVIKNHDGSLCRKTFLLTTPLERQLDPKIAYFYSGNGKWSEFLQQNHLARWSPLIFVDLSYSDEILVNLSPMRWIWPSRDVNLSIFSVYDFDDFSHQNKTKNEKHLLIANERIHPQKYDKNTVGDLGAGIEQTLYAFLDNNQCELVCDKNSFAALQRRQPQSVELTKRPKVLILYTDDCQQHTDAVMALCKILEENANAICFVDQKEFLQNPTVRPGVWLVEKLGECDFVLTIFSECSRRVMAGQKLAQRRHFSDYFNCAVRFVISKINDIASNEGLVKNGVITHRRRSTSKHQRTDLSIFFAILDSTLKNGGITSQDSPKYSTSETCENSTSSRLNQFAFARFSYSPSNSIPPFFKSTLFCAGFGSLILPQNIGHLIAWIHGILNDKKDLLNETEKNNRFEHQADLSPLNDAIEEFKRFELENPNWMNERFDIGKDKGEEQCE